MNETLKTILNRRSIRSYKPEQLRDEELQTILEAGKFAPSGMNTQPWHFTVVQNKELLQSINATIRESLLKSGNEFMKERAKAENFSVFYHAPTLLLVSGDENALTPQYDCTFAMANMLLAAESLGIGACFIYGVVSTLNTAEGEALRKELGIPAGYKIYCSAACGYKAEAPSPAPRKEGTVNIIK